MENTTRRQFRSRMDAKQDVWRAIPALMGDGNGTIEVPNQQNMVYIRVGDGDLGQAFNNRCQLRDNLAVYVGYDPITDPDRRIFQVLSVRMADYAGAGNVTVPNVGPHHTTHEFGGGDDTYIDWRRLMGLRVGRPAAFVVTVDPGYIFRAGWIAIASTNVNLTATHTALVGVQAQYVLISISGAGVITATAGAVVASPTVLTIADVPTPPAGHIPLAAVRLYKMQTAIGDTPAAPDIVDLRFPTYNATALSSNALTKLSTTTGVDMRTVASTTLYTVPTGVAMIPVMVVIRNNSASLAGGTDYDFTGWLQAVDLSGMTVTTGYRILQSADNTTYTPTAAGANFQITVNTGSAAACTATIDLFGYLV